MDCRKTSAKAPAKGSIRQNPIVPSHDIATVASSTSGISWPKAMQRRSGSSPREAAISGQIYGAITVWFGISAATLCSVKPAHHSAVQRDGPTACRSRLGFEARYCAVADVVAPADLRAAFASLPACQGFSLLMKRELRLRAWEYPTLPRSLQTLPRAGPDQLAFEFGQAPEDRQHKATMRRGGICPGIR
jgi:hypothetical protein